MGQKRPKNGKNPQRVDTLFIIKKNNKYIVTNRGVYSLWTI